MLTRNRLRSHCDPVESRQHPSLYFKIHFNITLPSTLRSLKWSLPFIISDQNYFDTLINYFTFVSSSENLPHVGPGGNNLCPSVTCFGLGETVIHKFVTTYIEKWAILFRWECFKKSLALFRCSEPRIWFLLLFESSLLWSIAEGSSWEGFRHSQTEWWRRQSVFKTCHSV